MTKRKLKRQLGLAQIVMLGTAGTIGAQIFVLTGHAAGISGPATILAFLVGGLLSYSIALNYCELATSYPVTGGAMTYVREAFGNGLPSFLVGSMDCLSSTFYAALSAVGFAYSVQVFLPWIPITLTAVGIIIVFIVLNILGVGNIGKLQVILGIGLLSIFGIYVVAGLLSPNGFRWDVFVPGGNFFIPDSTFGTISRILRTIALVYVAYVGFEVIADDAEEAQDPHRVIPRGILISLTLVIVINILTVTVTLGTLNWQTLSGSETALTDVVRRFLPGVGIPLMAVGGIIATLTSINTSMLSATREAFTLSRDGVWPRALSKLSKFRTPHVAVLAVGGVSAVIAVIGLVDFLSYISSAGYLFVLFWASLAMIRLRKLYPDIERPFKVPFFPLTAYMAAATCLLIVAFTEVRALIFGGGIIALLTLAYFLVPSMGQWVQKRIADREPEENLILIAAATPETVKSLVHLAAIVAQASEDTYVCMMSVISPEPGASLENTHQLARRLRPQQQSLMTQIAGDASAQNVALYSKVRAASSVAEGILQEIDNHRNLRLLLTGWPGPLKANKLADNPVKVALQKARTNVAVLLDRGLDKVNHILVPVGGELHSRMAIRLANETAMVDMARVTALRLITTELEEEEIEDQHLYLAEIVEEAIGSVPENFDLQVVQATSIAEGILEETNRHAYNLVVIGASEEWSQDTRLFGTIDDWVAENVTCSVILCRRYEPVTIAWLRYQVKMIEREFDKNENRENS